MDMGSEGHLEAIWGPVRRVDSGVDSGSILGHSWTVLGPFLGNLIELPYLAFIWPWVGTSARI